MGFWQALKYMPIVPKYHWSGTSNCDPFERQEPKLWSELACPRAVSLLSFWESIPYGGHGDAKGSLCTVRFFMSLHVRCANAALASASKRPRRRPGGYWRRPAGAAVRVESRRCGRLPGRLLAFAGIDFFREQRCRSRLGWRAGTVQEKLSGSRRDGTIGFLGIGVSLFGAGLGTRPGAMALEAGER